MSRRLQVTASMALAVTAAAFASGPATAHPLGNATVSRAVAVEVAADQVRVVSILDMAEIPAFTSLQAIDADGDGTARDDERSTWATARCEEARRGLDLRWDMVPLALRLTGQPALSFPAGVGGLETLRLECSFFADIAADRDEPHRLDMSDTTDDGRPGWREITIVAASGWEVVDSDVPAVSPSQALTMYPEDLLTAPLDVRVGWARLSPAGSTGSAPDPTAPPRTFSPGQPAPGDPLVSIITQPAGVGGGFGGLLALLLSAGLGAVHALSPGHGKALVAASLVGSRGTPRQAIWLGIAVAASHTGGVLVLGVIVLGAGSVLAPDRLLAWLSLAAGACVVAVGGSLVLRGIAAFRRGSAAGHAHPHRHEHPHGADPSHAHPHPEGLRTRGVVALGLFGGLVPSTSAVIVLLLAVTTGQLVLGLALIVAFGLGMAIVLGGLAVVSSMLGRWLAESSMAKHSTVARIGASIPLVSGTAVLVAGAAMAAGALRQVL